MDKKLVAQLAMAFGAGGLINGYLGWRVIKLMQLRSDEQMKFIGTSRDLVHFLTDMNKLQTEVLNQYNEACDEATSRKIWDSVAADFVFLEGMTPEALTEWIRDKEKSDG